MHQTSSDSSVQRVKKMSSTIKDLEPVCPKSINTGDEQLDAEAARWLSWDKNEDTRMAIRKLVESKAVDELRRLLMHRMEFGTAGLRTRMGPGNSQMNDLTVIQTTQGLVKYLKEALPDSTKKGVVIGFDGRYNSEKWSKLAATVCVNADLPVYLFQNLCPTPYVAFALRTFGASCGIMVTASHNPKEDNGYKVYWDNGAQIIPPHDLGISQAIEESLKPLDSSWDTAILKKESVKHLIIDPMDDVIHKYNEAALAVCYTRERNSECPVRFTYTAMHGVGYEFVCHTFKTFDFKDPIPVVEQVRPDPDFPTVKYPNPEEGEGALKLAMETADKNRSKVILANDPDADRLAIAEKTESGWRVFSGNEIGALIGWWCWTSWRQKNPNISLSDVYMLSSTVSSKILQAIAQREGFNFTETLTGFKWMGNVADTLLGQGKHVLFAFEEAIGYMCGSTVLDKDGVIAAAVVAELVNHLYSNQGSLSQQLEVIYKRYGYHLNQNSYFLCHDADTIKAMFERLRNFNGTGMYPTNCGEFEITHVRDLTVGYDSEAEDMKPTLPTSKSSQMITFKFSNDCVATLRTSGTEPKIKYYTELRTNPEKNLAYDEVQAQLQEIVKDIVHHFYNQKLFPNILARQSYMYFNFFNQRQDYTFSSDILKV